MLVLISCNVCFRGHSKNKTEIREKKGEKKKEKEKESQVVPLLQAFRPTSKSTSTPKGTSGVRAQKVSRATSAQVHAGPARRFRKVDPSGTIF
jgi:hypothetical protein